MNLEEKARQYADNICENTPKAFNFNGVVRTAIENAYIAGASEPLRKEWIDVNVYLPPYEKTVLVRVDRHKCNSKQRQRYPEFRFSYRESESGFSKDRNDFMVGYGTVTHWMYLPPIPDTEEQ